MKKVFIAFMLLVASTGVASAQLLGIHPRFEAGVSLPKIESALGGADFNGSASTGYRVGAAIELPIAPFIYIVPGVSIRSNKVSYDATEETIGAVARIIDGVAGTNFSTLSSLGIGSSSTLTYAIVPVNLGVRLGLAGFAVSAEAGPYGGYAINSGPFANDRFSERGLSFNKFTYGIGANIAAHLGKTIIRLGYEYELSKKFSTSGSLWDNNPPKYSDNAFYLTLGYRL